MTFDLTPQERTFIRYLDACDTMGVEPVLNAEQQAMSNRAFRKVSARLWAENGWPNGGPFTVGAVLAHKQAT